MLFKYLVIPQPTLQKLKSCFNQVMVIIVALLSQVYKFDGLHVECFSQEVPCVCTNVFLTEFTVHVCTHMKKKATPDNNSYVSSCVLTHVNHQTGNLI